MLEPKWVEARQLPEGEEVYLKKDFLGWRVVEPWKNKDDSINWFNLLLGGKRNLATLGFIILLALSLYLGFHEQLENAKMVIENPCAFADCISAAKGSILSSPINLTLP